jgi:dolichyl-diphosphooligosaccharide--protein glycosyltransferase
MGRISDPKALMKKLLPLVLLFIVFSSALWLRSFPARFSEIQALDPFFFYRMGLDVMQNNWELGIDMMRYHPTGVDTAQYHYLLPIYLPAFVYTLMTGIGMNMHYLHFAIMWPAWLGALAVIPMYFLGKELFGRKAGLFAAFFLATIPAFITRTSAGFFEKEPIAGIFIVTSVLFFTRALKRSSLPNGLVSGVSLAMASLAWGGVQYIYMLFAGFLALIFLANIVVVILDYLFSGFGRFMKTLEYYMSPAMIKAYVPVMLLGILVQQFFGRHIAMTSISIVASFGLMAILLLRYGVDRFSLVKKEYIPYVVPVTVLLIFAGSLVGAMFSDFMADNMRQVTGLLTFGKSVIGTTVAENAPGTWDNVASTTGAAYAKATVPALGSVSPYLSIWIFMFLGIAILVYRFFRTREWIMLLPVIWLITAIMGVFYFVRLIFLLGPPAALSAGIFASWFIDRSRRTKGLNRTLKKLSFQDLRLNISHIVIVIFVALTLSVCFASAYAYSLNLGPSICFPRYNSDNPFDVEPCITIDEEGNEVMSANQPWYEAFRFLAEETPEGSSVLSWWDFGYWFQVRGERPSIADGGHTGGAYSRTDYEIADWYVDDADNWDSYKEWFKERDIDYILMDYTLPGKYGAISKIASDGEQVVGMLQFNQKGMEPTGGNQTIYIFQNGPVYNENVGAYVYYEIWLPLEDSGNLGGTPMFLIQRKDTGQYYQKSYINDVCTKSGVIKYGNEDPSIPGCVAVSNLGVYYIPPEAEHSIFTSLMFMDAPGLPLNKVYDNTMVMIYEVDYDNW